VSLRKSRRPELLLWGCLFLSSVSWAGPLPLSHPYRGGIIVLPIAQGGQTLPKAYFKDRRVMVIQNKAGWYAIIGLSLDLLPGEYQLQAVDEDGGNTAYRFLLRNKKYPTQYIRVKKKKWVTPNASQLKRFFAEKKKMQAVFSTWTPAYPPVLSFELPVQGRLKDNFGNQRFFNNQPRKPHSGIDISAPSGTTVTAPAAGTVTLTGDFFFNGKSVFIDHGQGLISMLNHLSKIDVSTGMRVRRGQKIGEVGSTGRTTGPHLHWSVSLNDSRINPLLLTQGVAGDKGQ